MFSQFQAEIKICGCAVTQTILKTELIGFQQEVENERVYQAANSDFQNVKTLKMLGNNP